MNNSVSVLLPVYFRTDSKKQHVDLARCLDSVFSQQFPSDWEIIVVDDGSAIPVSATLSELSPAFASRIRFIRVMRNSGLVRALNIGLSQARHDLIARIDADDWWEAGKIEKQLSIFASDPNVSIVGTGMRMTFDNGSLPIDLVRSGSWHGVLQFLITEGCPFPHGSIVAKADIFRLIGGYPHSPSFSHCEDYATWSTWLRFFKPAMIEEVLYNYSVSSSSVSQVHAMQQRCASAAVHGRDLGLDVWQNLPSLLPELARLSGLNVLDAGKIAFICWRYYNHIAVPSSLGELLAQIIPDRQLLVSQSADSFEINSEVITAKELIQKTAQTYSLSEKMHNNATI